MKTISDKIKGAVFIAIVLFLGVISAVRLMKIQIVKGDDIVNMNENSVSTLVYTRNTKATRGEIVDFSGNLIVGNKTSTDIILQKALFPEDNQKGNEILLQVYRELKERGFSLEQEIPVSDTAPYVFTGEEKDQEKLKKDINLNVYATAENCIDKLIYDYDISDSYAEDEKRAIAGIRYQMMISDFSYSNDFILAKNVDSETVIALKEMSNYLRGVNASESAVREIVQGNVLPHEIGTVGPIYAEQYDELKNEGYSLDDTLGKSGIEAAMESQLRGQNGEEKITVQNGSIVNSETISDAEPGKTVRLTINSTYQIKLQNILDSFIANFPRINDKPQLKNVHSGAIVVLDAKTGALKGAATAPTYNLLDYSNNYEAIQNAENSPLLNRATYGLYLPGSTFKTITATAGLNEGIVDGKTELECHQKYPFMGHDYQCTGYHNSISVTRAIEVSCNSYFYELSRRLNIDNISKYATLYGLGQHTGIETGDAAGYLANPETFAANGQEWYIGYVLQAGIGNYGSGVTPLQMAVVANTIANEGVRYKPYLVDSLYDYGTEDIAQKTEPTVAERIPLNYDYVYDYIEQGMIDASHNVPERYSLSNLGFDVAIKTGTPQTDDNGGQNSFFIGYAPADEPELAFAGVIEGGEYSKYMIRDIILAYQECYGLKGSKPTAVLESQVTGTATGTDITTGSGTSQTETSTTTVTSVTTQ
ncbi:MAG: hypothetical protein MR434_03815 [Ruminococcus sp.]|nr:hypothetical protein [Ruminococcus sp.]